MSRSAYFVSAPTLRFLRAVEQLRLLPAPQRRRIAAGVYAEIRPHIGSPNVEELCAAARAAQDERWRLIYCGRNDMTDARFAGVVVAEQWLVAQAELVRAARPVAEVLAEKRRDAIEGFIRDNLPAEGSEVIDLHAYAPHGRRDGAGSSKTAA